MYIPVTKPFLPPKEAYEKFLEQIWKRNWLTNNGPLVNDLELKLKNSLQLDHLLFLNNGTIALQMAYKVLELKGKVVTTPFTYIATISSAVWEGLDPIFCDIDPDTFNVNVDLIESKITEDTSAILMTHVFGNPCRVDVIQKIADKHNLKVIYDAAHCFGVTYQNKSLYGFGDVSTASFHATKIFHTIEGGALIMKDPELTKKFAQARNFGHNGFEEFDGVGINGKNSEFHAAMGLSILPFMNEILSKREVQYSYYIEKLKTLNVQFQKIESNTNYNYSYFPIVFNTEEQLLKSKAILDDHGVFCRRYFYPSLNKLQYVSAQTCEISESISHRILCLPLYHDLTVEDQDYIVRLLLRIQNN